MKVLDKTKSSQTKLGLTCALNSILPGEAKSWIKPLMKVFCFRPIRWKTGSSCNKTSSNYVDRNTSIHSNKSLLYFVVCYLSHLFITKMCQCYPNGHTHHRAPKSRPETQETILAQLGTKPMSFDVVSSYYQLSH